MQVKESRRLVLVELNEVNLDFAREYVANGRLPNLSKVLSGRFSTTTAEDEYELLEPWIQWVSGHTGKSAREHGVFRLGDIVKTNTPQIFELLEEHGYKVGAVSPMNAANRMKSPAYFIPDPWTATTPDPGKWSQAIAGAISQAVNDNAESKLTKRSLLIIFAALFKFAQVRKYWWYVRLALTSRGSPWRKALFLDMLLNDIHLVLLEKMKPNFSTVFLNAGAHIQHHYLFNCKKLRGSGVGNPAWYVDSSQDPFEEMLMIYDKILGDYLGMDNFDLIVATGLTQKPYDRIKYYWRLKDCAKFLNDAGIKNGVAFPRMTRDFLVEFGGKEEALRAQKILAGIKSKSDAQSVFGEIDNRGASLFVTLTYPHEIKEKLMVEIEGVDFDLKPYLSFVALKNGMHESKGYIYFRGADVGQDWVPDSHIKVLHSVIRNYFRV